MNVAYILNSSNAASYKFGTMILPQLEAGDHGAQVAGIFFFDDHTFVLRRGDAIGQRLSKLAQAQGILLMMCDQCALQRSLATGAARNAQVKDTVPGVRVGCFPDLYAALGPNPPDQVITL
jgi:sulfur relay (sulfurtransferase) complex TusBCD TusD component (DsrE family)